MVMKNTKKLQPSNDCKDCNNIQMHSGYYKLVLVIRTDLKMGKGKVAAQCAHAAVAAYKAAIKRCPIPLTGWEYNGQPKITLKVDSEDALKEIAAQARDMGLLTNIIEDAGHTQIKAGSKTCCT
ncbi:PREDICTED: peptidyl-tRNA hydrolase 2, mitochondrial-like isoform X1 [Eufriesea mexicana]|uniref:peptidyl-tRNA hydrolase 2, mitochondrial-like isoform X1 n=1 Tax=Eufriesea mexicana TaxID=516756 RepID=UPI00083BE1CA|nr:PREDICTED: peptidyl-tRNA hydrolase 2, mitochondrial-like isoform X1 [Eufriesea mexicana]